MMRICFCLLFIICLFPLTASAQTTVGFENPENTTNLLDYRLPDWSYHTWTAGLALDGRSKESRLSGQQTVNNTFNLRLESSYWHNQESEKRDYDFGARVTGSMRRYSNSYQSDEYKSREDRGEVYVRGSLTEYLQSGPFFLSFRGSDQRSYSGSIVEEASESEWTKNTTIWRVNRTSLSGGVGYGKLRNVVPLLRAQRLNERLKALGQPQLSSEEIQQVARVLATDYGYRAVYDRPDRRFWRDVLAPLVKNQAQLSPFEVMYLMEVLNEYQGDRYQGFRVSLDYQWYERADRDDDEWLYFHNISPVARVDWSTNLTLHQQIRTGAQFILQKFKRSGDEDHEYRPVTGYVEHLWNVTDRTMWTNQLSYSGFFDVSSDRDSHSFELSSKYEIYLEDKLNLWGEITGQFENRTEDAEVDQSWTMTYRIGLQYDLHRAFLN